MNNDGNKKGMFILGTLIGAAVGAGAVFLLATDKGKKLQKEALRKGEQTLKHLEKEGTKLVKKGEKAKDEFIEDVTDRIEDAKETVNDITTQTIKKADVARKQLFKNIPKK